MIKSIKEGKDYIVYEVAEPSSHRRIAQFSIGYQDPNYYYLFDVKSFEPGGGSIMMEEIINFFDDKPIYLDVREDNERARHTYEKFGFKPIYFWSDEKDITYIEMCREADDTYE